MGRILPEYASYIIDKARLFLYRGQLDSAESCFRRSMAFDELRPEAYRGMIRVWKQSAEADSLVKYVLLLDSLQTVPQQPAVAETAAMLEYSRQERDARTRQLVLRRLKISVIGIAMFTMACLLYIRYKRRYHELRMQHVTESLVQTRRELSTNRREADLLRSVLPELQQVRQLLDEKQRRIGQLESQIEIYQRQLDRPIPENDNEALMQSDIVGLFRHICQMHTHKEHGIVRKEEPRACSESEWQELMHAVQTYHYSLFYMLTTEKRLPRLQLRVCVLSRLGFFVSEIAVLLGTTIQNVSNARSRAANRLFGSGDTSLLDTALVTL